MPACIVFFLMFSWSCYLAYIANQSQELSLVIDQSSSSAAYTLDLLQQTVSAVLGCVWEGGM